MAFSHSCSGAAEKFLLNVLPRQNASVMDVLPRQNASVMDVLPRQNKLIRCLPFTLRSIDMSVKQSFGKSLLMLALVAAIPAAAVASKSDAASDAKSDDVQTTGWAEPAVGREMMEALERDLGITRAQLPQYQATEQRAAEIEAQAKSQFADTFAGTWIERATDGSFFTVVASTDDQAKATFADAEVRTVKFTLNALEDGMSMLNGALSAVTHTRGGSRDINTEVLHTWYVDVKTNAVVMTVEKGAEKSALDFLAVSGIDSRLVRLEQSAGRPEPAVARNVYGGRQYGSGGGSCSIGFAVTRGTTKGFATAGHCGRSGTSVSIGGEGVGSVQGASFPTNDYGWANVRSTDILNGFVDRYNGGTVLDIDIVGSTESATGSSICRSGFASGYRCGTVGSKNVTVNYSAGATFQLTQSTACLTQGDSGGSWITASGQAQGVSSGGQLNGASPGTNCGFSTPVSYFQKLNEILSAYGLTLVR
jgi:alpha-lytic endopeptidase